MSFNRNIDLVAHRTICKQLERELGRRSIGQCPLRPTAMPKQLGASSWQIGMPIEQYIVSNVRRALYRG
jgi:hypothetical protein